MSSNIVSKLININKSNSLPLYTSSIDEVIAQDNEIILVNLFGGSLTFSDLGFVLAYKEDG
jgi:hypothetical protein